MRKSFLVIGVLLCAMAAPAALPATAQDHAGHHPTAQAARAATPAPGRRWATDAPLRKGMLEIRAAVDALRHYEHGHLRPEHAMTLATTVESRVAFLIANCKLEPQADAALHAIIALLLEGTVALKADPADSAAIATLRQALQEYPRRFDDPGWTTAEQEER